MNEDRRGAVWCCGAVVGRGVMNENGSGACVVLWWVEGS